MEINTTNNSISVHGREALDLPYSRWSDDVVPVQVDISASDIFIEIPAANLRKKLVVNPDDIKGLRIYLTRAEVEKLPTVPSPFVLIDETTLNNPTIEYEGRIFRTGYKGEPTPPVSLP